jgi:hypothetical protein
LWARVVRYAWCADILDADEWFPVSAEPARTRLEAAAAIAVCTSCPVRVDCLALSLRHRDIGQHGVWGGLGSADGARLSRGLPAIERPRRGTAVARREGAPALSRMLRRLMKGGGTFSECCPRRHLPGGACPVTRLGSGA